MKTYIFKVVIVWAKKIALHADGIVCFLEDPFSSMKVLRSVISQFSLISDYMVNENTSIIVSFNMAQQEKQNLLDLTHAKRQDDNIQYLDIKICRTYRRMIQENIDPVINYMKDKCCSWETLKLSWFGRIATVKMIITSQIIICRYECHLAHS